jgi:hypothetical protein
MLRHETAIYSALTWELRVGQSENKYYIFCVTCTILVEKIKVINLAHLTSVFGHGQHHNLRNKVSAYTIYSRTSIIRAAINRASHRYAVPLHFQCASGVVSG